MRRSVLRRRTRGKTGPAVSRSRRAGYEPDRAASAAPASRFNGVPGPCRHGPGLQADHVGGTLAVRTPRIAAVLSTGRMQPIECATRIALDPGVKIGHARRSLKRPAMLPWVVTLSPGRSRPTPWQRGHDRYCRRSGSRQPACRAIARVLATRLRMPRRPRPPRRCVCR
jgi:hypothetical protein